VQPEYKGFENPLQMSSTPCKNSAQPTQQQWGTIRRWICAQKWRKMGFMGENGFRNFGEKMEKKWGKWWQMDGQWRLYGAAVTVGWWWDGVWVVGFGY
jgi:hypothetical protein